MLNQGILATPGPFVVAVVFSGCALGTGGAPIEHAISAFAPALGPGQTATLLFPVPAQCPTNQFTIMVDPSGSVPESNKMNNVMVVQCGMVPR